MRFVKDMRDRLIDNLAAAYREIFRLEWQSGREAPHFFDQQQSWFNVGFSDAGLGPYVLTRGFLAAEAVAEGDLVLDIGCGDGFYTARFLAPRAAEVHGLDCDQPALDAARARNSAPKVCYFLADAAAEAFPAPAYDLVAWNGSIGHFAPEAARTVLAKVAACLKPGGLFVGSESLGDEENADHLLILRNEAEAVALLGTYFRQVEVRVQSFPIAGGTTRHEIYWRCAQSPEPLERLAFSRHSRG